MRDNFPDTKRTQKEKEKKNTKQYQANKYYNKANMVDI